MSFACRDFSRSQGFSRRSLLRAGGLGMLGLSLPNLLRASEQVGSARIAPVDNEHGTVADGVVWGMG